MKLMVIGFPKSGTTSITNALKSSGLKAAHWQDEKRRFVGALIYKAVLAGLDPFEHLKGYDAVTQADVCLPAHNLSLLGRTSTSRSCEQFAARTPSACSFSTPAVPKRSATASRAGLTCKSGSKCPTFPAFLEVPAASVTS